MIAWWPGGWMLRRVVVGLATALIVAVAVVVRSGGLAAIGAGGDGQFRFIAVEPGTNVPITYSSCKPIRVEFNLEGARDQGGARQVLLEAMGEVSAASHLSLTWVGDSKRRPRWPDPTLTVRGGAWPVLIGFSDSDEVRYLQDHVAGVGGSTTAVVNGNRYYVTGEVALARDYFNQLLARGKRDLAKAIVMHELGHVMGLDHVGSTHEIMNAAAGRTTHFGKGDRAGLKLLGEGACL